MDLVCFSHLRWNFVYQRPQHLMSRFAGHFRVFFVEEPIFDNKQNHLELTSVIENVLVVVPHLKEGTDPAEIPDIVNQLLNHFLEYYTIKNYIAWFYTPMALDSYLSLEPASLVVYDCMDELSLFKDAPSALVNNERRLLKYADLLFTGGVSLYEAKRKLHSSVFAFPSSIDKKHFGKARLPLPDPEDQAPIGRPRIGFFGVIDERFDRELVSEIAQLRPDWNFVMLGPIVKIDSDQLPKQDNIHFLGMKSYFELPNYLAGWDVAIIPFALNASTKFISPTKTPEYLAGGRPVVSTPISDIIKLYGKSGLIYIGATPSEFVKEIEKALLMKDNRAWLKVVDTFLASVSWDSTWEKMMFQINTKLEMNNNKLLHKKYG